MEDLHLKAARTMMGGLKHLGIIKVRLTLSWKKISLLFSSSRLGTFLGLDTHDVGGYPKALNALIDQALNSYEPEENYN